MKITIRQPLWFTEIGSKDNQEDFLWPNPQKANDRQRVFVLCDGVGGQDCGEIASETAATALGVYITSHRSKDGGFSEKLFNEALSYAYDELDKKDDPSLQRKMGTTMACLVFHRGGVLAAHIGDTRIYHIRPSLANTENGLSGIIYQSADHSLVNDLLRAGELTDEEARNFTQKNVITRAMQPKLERRYKAEIYNIDDVQEGDFFFICCDGVLEQLSNEKLGAIIAEESFNDEDKIAAIKSVCDGKTKDNYTCWLIPVDNVVRESSDKTTNEELIATISSSETDSTIVENPSYAGKQDIPRITKPIKKPSPRYKWLGILSFLCLIGIISVVFIFGKQFIQGKRDNNLIDSTTIVGNLDDKKDSIRKTANINQDTNAVEKAASSKLGIVPKENKGEIKKRENKSTDKVEAKPQEQEKPEEVNSVKPENTDKKKSLLINNSTNQDSPNGKQ